MFSVEHEFAMRYVIPRTSRPRPLKMKFVSTQHNNNIVNMKFALITSVEVECSF